MGRSYQTSEKIRGIVQTSGVLDCDSTEGQLISKAIYGVLDSPKKRTKKI